MILLGIAVLLVLLIGACQLVIAVTLSSQITELRRRLNSTGGVAVSPLQPGLLAPDFEAIDVRCDSEVSSHEFHGKEIYLLFLSTDCGVCRGLASEIRALSSELASRLIIYCNGRRRGCGALLKDAPIGVRVLCAKQASVSALFEVPGFPVGVLLDHAWKIRGYRYPNSGEDISYQLSSMLTSAQTETVDAYDNLSSHLLAVHRKGRQVDGNVSEGVAK